MVISGMLAGTITALSLTPMTTQRQKNNYSTAEGMAIAIRKYVADTNNKVTFASDANITDANIPSALKSSNQGSCSVKTNYSPPKSTAVIPYAVECNQGSGNVYAQAWQPLYTVTNFTEQIGAGTGTIAIDQCLEQISSARLVYSSNPGTISLSSSDLSKYSNCATASASVTFTTSGWSVDSKDSKNDKKTLCDFFIDGNVLPVNLTGIFKKSDCT